MVFRSSLDRQEASALEILVLICESPKTVHIRRWHQAFKTGGVTAGPLLRAAGNDKRKLPYSRHGDTPIPRGIEETARGFEKSIHNPITA